MIQDILPHQFNNHYLANNHIGENDFILCYKERSILLKSVNDEDVIPRKKDFPHISEKTDLLFLFTLNNVSCFLYTTENFDNIESQLNFNDINILRNIQALEQAWIGIVGFHLSNWYLHNKFCGKCGSIMQHKMDERALECSSCKALVYPKISPAIIVAIKSNDKILLARNAQFAGNWYSLIAGYTDIGETLEETVLREVKEEVGIDVKNIRYYKSQPWPFSSSLMIGFIAEADENQPITIDKKEIAEAAWFSRDNLPNYPANISIAGEMIEKFKKGEL